MSQVHKETLTAVDNALPNRVGLDIEIFGMEGIPEEVAQQHNQRVLQQYHEAQAQRQASSGAGGGAGGPKKPKFDDVKMSLKERLAAHKAAKAAAQDGDASTSGGNTPVATLAAPAPGTFVSYLLPFSKPLLTVSLQAGSSYQQQPYTAPPTNGSYSQPPAYSPAQATAPGFPPQQISYGQPPAPYGQVPQPPFIQTQAQPYAQPPQPNFQQHPPGPGSYPSQPAFSPSPYQGQSPYPGQVYPQNGASPYPGQQRSFSGSPVPPMNQHVSPPPAPSHFPKPVHTGTVSLPTAPGLPQRPAVGAPPISGFQFQQMHQGAIPAPPSHNMQYQKQESAPGVAQSTAPPAEIPSSSAIDDLVSSAGKQADASATQSPAAPAVPAPAEKKDKPAEDKKDKAKATRLVYQDTEVSMEEKLASLSRFAFTAQQTPIAT